MKDYESKYEEYKKSLLQSPNFMDGLKEKYRNTLVNEADFIDRNGALSKIAILSGLCGLCTAFFFILGSRTNAASIIIRIILAIVGIACAFRAICIGSEYKKTSGTSNFYSFLCDRYIEDRVRSDKDREAEKLLQDMLKHIDALEWHTKKANITFMVELGDFEKRYEELSLYDRFSQDLPNDFRFNNAIHEQIK